MMRFIYITAILLGLVLLSSCSDGSYLLHSIKGQLDLMSRARPIDDLLAESAEPLEVREKLALVVQIRSFAINNLHLPDNGSYREYANLDRPYAVWNLVAAPELSLDLNQWCFPIAGCVTYRGYFVESYAKARAEYLGAMGFDVDVYGVQAYSTLNWFNDPVLNTFLADDDINLAALLFHEMAHQVIYVPNDTAFNEAFAKTVEMEGLRRWFQSRDSDNLWQKYLQREKHSAEFYAFLAQVREKLSNAYTAPVNNDQKRLAKESILAHALEDYTLLKASWDGYDGFDQWMLRGLNNARLSSVATYHELVPAFQLLLRQVNNDLQYFYREVKSLAELPAQERLVHLQQLLPRLKASL